MFTPSEWMNICGGIKAGAQIGLALNDYFAQRAKSNLLRLQADAREFDARQMLYDAEAYYNASAGAQNAGWQEATIRGMRLAQDVGRTYTGAAGAGIDVSSAVRANVEESMRREAAWDIGRIGENSTSEAKALMTKAGAAMANYHIGMGEAAVLRQNAKITRANAWGGIAGGLLSAFGTLAATYGMSGMAGARAS